MKQKISKKKIAICMLVFVLMVAVYTVYIKFIHFAPIVDTKPQIGTLNDSTTITDSKPPMGAPNSISARDAGLLPNDKSKASENGNMLVRALNKYNNIIIDDSYYIATPTEPLTTNTVEIIGTDDSELIAADNAYTILFNPGKLSSFSLKNIKFTNNNKDNELLIVYNGNSIDTKVDNVDIRDCTFTGNISLYRQYGNKLLNPENDDYGIGKFLFKNNKVYNTKLSFIVLRDIPVEYCEISDNTVHNFMYTFLSIGVTNDTPIENILYDHIDYLKVDSNSVICEDEWWGDTTSGSYYTFILFEGTEVLYNNNHVEGIKSLGDIAIYDAYLSAQIVNYTNNIWKNNICFYPHKLYNALIKSKGGRGPAVIRNYLNNKFIVEEDFAARVGQSKDNLTVDFMSLSVHADSYVISNNIFDIYDLRFPISSMLISNFSFNNNTIKVKKATGKLVILRLNDIYPTKSIQINSNIIDIEEKYAEPFYLLMIVDDRKQSIDIINNINVDGNRITAPFGYLLYEAKVDKLVFTNNTITDIGDEYSGFTYRGKINNSNIYNNYIESKNSIDFYEGRQLYGYGIMNEALNIARKNHSSENNGMCLDTKYNSVLPTKYKRTYQIDSQGSKYEFFYTFTISCNNSGYAEVTFDNEYGESKTYRLSINSSISDGNGQVIKVVDLVKGASKEPYIVKFFNENGKAGFYISNYKNEICDLKIVTTSYQ